MRVNLLATLNLEVDAEEVDQVIADVRRDLLAFAQSLQTPVGGEHLRPAVSVSAITVLEGLSLSLDFVRDDPFGNEAVHRSMMEALKPRRMVASPHGLVPAPTDEELRAAEEGQVDGFPGDSIVEPSYKV